MFNKIQSKVRLKTSLLPILILLASCQTTKQNSGSENLQDSSSDYFEKREDVSTKKDGFYVFGVMNANLKMIKPSLEDARKCSLSAGLPISEKEDLEFCNKAISNSEIGKENLFSTYLNRGMINTKLGNYNAAFADYDKAAEFSIHKGDVLFSRAITESYRYDYETMAELIELALKHDVRDRKKAYFFLGGAYELNFQFDLAREAYQNSLALDSDAKRVRAALDRLNKLWPE
jgi:tetratricopeptide (TPR) repeat protein